MRGIGYTLSRLPTARAMLFGAVVLAAMASPKAYGQPQAINEDTAMAVPRFAPRASGGASGGANGGGVALPQPLAPSEVARLRWIFALQARGDIAAAVRQSMALDKARQSTALDNENTAVDGVLGHLLAERHLGPYTRTVASDLQEWLARWPDLPDAPAIHALLKRRLPAGSKLPPPPPCAPLSPTDDPQPLPEESAPPAMALSRLPDLDRAVREAARGGRHGAAARVIQKASGLPPGYAALLRGEAGQILFALNRDAEAYEVASIGADACLGQMKGGCLTAASAGHWAGLAAWRMGRIAQAQTMFELSWAADIATPTQRAAAAFWAARTHLRVGDTDADLFWLGRAAAEQRTFHGLIARHVLGLALEGPALPRETLGEADIEAVAAHPGGLRAFALLQIGQPDRAEDELRLLWPQAEAAPGFARALMLVAEQAGLGELAAQIADRVERADGRPRPRTRFAVPRLRPAGGFTADPALVYAIARTESNFDPSLVSQAGARGLMQIMPATARFLAGMAEQSDGDDATLPALHDPAVNLSLGQRYLNFLAATEVVGGDKLRLLASYNSGPTAFGRWSAAIRDFGDPLLFIEAIPIDETRAFVPRVLAHTWLYASRLRLPAPSLGELANGAWPRYTRADSPVATLH